MISNDQIKAAAKWWTDQLRQPGEWDNGDAMTSALAAFTINKCRKPKTDEELARYEKELEEVLTESAASQHGWMWINVDYHPCGMLVEAGRRANVRIDDMFDFPCKTHMHLTTDGRVTVSAGYRAEDQQIWPPQESVAKAESAS